MEVRMNEAVDVYRELYYEGGVSSVYFWNLDDGFAGVVLLKKCKSPQNEFGQRSPLLTSCLQRSHQLARVKVRGTRYMSSKLSTGREQHTTNSRVRSYCI